MGISLLDDPDDDAEVRAASEQGFFKTNEALFEEDEAKIDCCLDGEDGLVNVVDEDETGEDGGDSFSSARFLFTPCSTGSNSSERLSEATASIA